MARLPQVKAGIRPQLAEDRVRAEVQRVAGRQWGTIRRNQLIRCGLSSQAISRWTRSGRLRRIHSGVYAVGLVPLGVEGRIAAALLYSGRGAGLSHAAAAWVWGLAATQPNPVDVSTSRRRASVPGVRVHSERNVKFVRRGRWPVTTPAQTLLDLAPSLTHRQLRRALAEADYRRLLDLDAVRAELRSGCPGSAALRRAVDNHLPLLARTASDVEELFVELCESRGIPLPEVNVPVCGFKVDALWREQRLIVELDGGPAHGTAAQMHRDRERDLVLRAAGYRIVRYTWHQVTGKTESVAADLVQQLSPPANSARTPQASRLRRRSGHR